MTVRDRILGAARADLATRHAPLREYGAHLITSRGIEAPKKCPNCGGTKSVYEGVYVLDEWSGFVFACPLCEVFTLIMERAR